MPFEQFKDWENHYLAVRRWEKALSIRGRLVDHVLTLKRDLDWFASGIHQPTAEFNPQMVTQRLAEYEAAIAANEAAASEYAIALFKTIEECAAWVKQHPVY